MRYEKPEILIVMFEEKDVITTSNLVDTGTPGGGLDNLDDVIKF